MSSGAGKAAILVIVLFCWAAAAGAGELRGRVTYVYDGDTVEVAGVGTVRLLGIDTPEHEASSRDAFYQRFGIPPERLREIARQARATVGDLTKDQEVRLQTDEPRHDRHDRLLAYLFLPDGRLLNQVLLERGLASVYRRFEFARKGEFLVVEAKARRQRLGLWGKRDL